jgi:primase-polymerase (primpol)-like protein
MPTPYPATLRALPQWVCWSWVDRADAHTGELKRTKIPIQATTGRAARSTDPATWADFPTAYRAAQRHQYSGVGFVFAPDDGLIGIDLDHCLSDGRLSARAADVVARIPSYTEITPSGTGLHIIGRGTLPTHGRHYKRDGFSIELYPAGRFFTMSGRVWAGTPADVLDCQAALDTLYAELFPDAISQTAPAPAVPSELSDGAILRIASGARNGDKFRALWRGDWEHAGYVSESEADLALLGILVFYTRDSAQLERLFRESGLYDGKWQDRAEYRDRTIARALSGSRPQFSGATA